MGRVARELSDMGGRARITVLVPGLSDASELELIQSWLNEEGLPRMRLGAMLETPRACLTAGKIAQRASFLSFGSNDLSALVYGLSRDDAGRFLPKYVEMKILADDPFQVLDVEGVGKLVEMGVKLGRSTRPDLKVGICGEHGGEPSSVEFCHRTGLNYVSCSPYRVPIARLAAAQAAIADKDGARASSGTA